MGVGAGYLSGTNVEIPARINNSGSHVRLKITRRLSGSIDGLQLSRFAPGEVYDVGTSLGSYLLAVGAAEPVLDETPARIVPLQEGVDEVRQTSRAGSFASAADKFRKH